MLGAVLGAVIPFVGRFRGVDHAGEQDEGAEDDRSRCESQSDTLHLRIHSGFIRGSSVSPRSVGLRVVLLRAGAAALPAAAQQLEPRAYSPSPVGANFIGVGY